ncbi:MAG: hypothetical protein ACTS4T_01560 [Candidatus Hodgkinia cicadicola]
MTLNSLRQRFTIDESGEARYAIYIWIDLLTYIPFACRTEVDG